MKNLIFSLIVLAFFINNAKAQNPLDDFTYQVYYKTTSTNPAVFDSLCTRVCKVTLTDTNNLSKIHVQIGTVADSTDILYHAFIFDQITGLPNGLTYKREGFNIYLGLFNTYHSDTYYYELKLEDSNGNFSSPKQWN